MRVQAGLAQGELARRAGLTRQAISAIESGGYVPNTAVVLRLAQVLGCRVEDLYTLPEPMAERMVQIVGGRSAFADGPEPAETAGSSAGNPPDSPPTRLAVGSVRGRWVGHPLVAGRDIQEGFISADGLLSDDPSSTRTTGDYAARVELLVPPERIEQTALLMGCDPSLGILSAHLGRRAGEARLVWLNGSSETALGALARGEVHLAGSHLRDAGSGEFNLPFARNALRGIGGLVVAFARWEQGLIVASGNPKQIRGIADLARPNVQIANREAGAGTRAMLDELLAAADIPSDVVQGYDRIATSHFALARLIASGNADAGIGLRAAAEAFGLDFIALAEVQFDLVIPRDEIDHPVVVHLLETLHSRRLRTELAALAGYDVSRIGSVVAEIPAA